MKGKLTSGIMIYQYIFLPIPTETVLSSGIQLTSEADPSTKLVTFTPVHTTMQGGKLRLEPASLSIHKSAKSVMDSIITSYIFVRPKVNTAKMNVGDDIAAGMAAGMATGFALNISSS
jgi:hypothetical protein